MKGGFLFHLGRYVLLIKSLFVKPERSYMYWKETARMMVDIGVGSVIIILVISFFIGAVSAVQFAYNLSDSLVPMYYVGYVVKESMILEFAPTVSCLILAGKIGSNISSELGTMRLTEQIDAPKIVAAITMIPLLVIIAALTGIIGGGVAAVGSGYMSKQEYIQGIQFFFVAKNINVMLVKAVVFAFLLTSISCYQGYYASGSAIEIGKASTRAVVISSIMVLLADYLIAWMML